MKYVIGRILKMDYKNFFSVIKKISKESKKIPIMIFLDIVLTGLKYKAGYMDYYLLKMYEMNSVEKSTYLVRGKNNELIQKLNKKEDIYILNNKIETNKLFNNYLKRSWSYLGDKNINKFLKENDKFIAKPSNGQCGKGIEIIETKNFKTSGEVVKHLKDRSLDLLEEIIKQHKSLNNINDSSVNTIRIVSIYNQKIFFIGACFRIGNKKFVDNFESGGMTAKVDVDSGLVLSPAIDKAGNIFYKHPVTDSKIEGFKIPFYKETLELIESMAKLVPTIRYVGWDIAITDGGPVLVEANPLPGSQITQMPYPGGKKEGCMPKINEALNYKM